VSPRLGIAAVAFAACAFAAAVGWPALAVLGLAARGSEVPESFDGARTLATTLGWASAAALGATAVGWPVGRAIRSARGGAWLLGVSLVAAALPPYAVFWSWWQAAGPGSSLGDWCARGGHAVALRECLLAVGLVSWSWPIAAWVVAGSGTRALEGERELGSIDGEGPADLLARAWRADRAALALAAAVTAFVLAGSTVAFDLAQVPTFGFELRTLDTLGTPAGAVVRAAAPAIAISLAGALALAAWPVRPRPEHAPAARAPGARVAWAVVLCTLAAPVAVLVLGVASRAALDRFAATAMRGTLGTFATAAAAGAAMALVALAHLALAARGAGRGRGARLARRAERAMLAGWTAWAAMPATIGALGLIAAWNREPVAGWAYDTPVIVALSHLGRFGAVAAWIGRVPALREPRERRDLRLVDGAGIGEGVAALAPEARGVMLASFLACTALAAGEVISSARVEPPGWAWSAASLLNAIHYQQPATVLGGLLAILALASLAGGGAAWAMRRADRRRALAAVALVALVAASQQACRDPSPRGAAIPAERAFGAPGRGRGQFEYPRALDVDPRDGTLLVVDRRARVQRSSPDGRHLGEWTMPEQALGKPTGLGVGPDGRVWVADTHYHRVICYSPEGAELLRFGGYGTEPGRMIYPCDCEVGPDGNVWVAEFGGNDRIQVFRPDGTVVRQVGGPGREPGRFERPQSIAFTADGSELVVADACNHRLQVFAIDGTPRRALGVPGEGPGELAYPYGLEVLPDGTALVTEFGNHRLQRIDLRDGRSLGAVRAVEGVGVPVNLHVIDGDRVRSVPSGENALRFPWAVGARGDRAFILDSGHSRVLVAPVDALK
jgi:DNA-binding beta-propeller fold protein YncE